MTESTEHPPMSPKDEATGKAVTTSIDVLVDLLVEMGFAASGEAEDDDAAATSLVIAEGVLARILSAYCRAHTTDDTPLEERDERAAELLATSERHVRDVFKHYWAHIRDLPDPPEPAT